MATVDLPAYLSRIGVAEPLAADLDTLRRVHLAHATSIPFENLDIHLSRVIRLDLVSIQAKLVTGGRGGYCFEHNRLLAAALGALGFEVTTLGARVGPGDPRVLRRTHMVLAVAVGGVDWLADVGFGAGGLLEPIPLVPGEPVDQPGRTFRVVETADGFALEKRAGEGWDVEYQYTTEEMYPADYEVASHYTSTHPDSGFVRTLTAQREGIDAQWVLRGRELTEFRGGAVTTTTVAEEDLLDTLAETFGLRFAPGTRFASPAVVEPGA
jgi:N-hydroxyarylamine O-acetyltransferase